MNSYFVKIGKQVVGPLAEADIRSMLNDKQITGAHLISVDQEQWYPADSLLASAEATPELSLEEIPSNEVNTEMPTVDATTRQQSRATKTASGMPPSTQKPPQVENYLIWAILSTALCCLPLGIVAIIKSTEVDKKMKQGDYEGALASSQKTKIWCIAALAGGVLVGFAWFLLFIIGNVLGSAGSGRGW